MNRFAITLAIIAIMAFGHACTKAEEPAAEEQQETGKAESVRERAERVGDFGDATLTRNLKKNLTGIIDKNAEHTADLEKAAGK
ncbi:hypothetical protein MNBD_NITROSPINAE01-812 [hydrothermal vent metagenome]|uniref:Uncharacterized protein n=1 Tax=hydrothermal vent metagenome TaxID=652676 RepID=A0A3B1CJ67_9ZZZZ